jgi:tetratricopeptide (TPR) repeat protein
MAVLEDGEVRSEEGQPPDEGTSGARGFESAASRASLLQEAAKDLGASIDRDRLNAAHDGLSSLDRRIVEDLSALTRAFGSLNDTVAPRTLLPFTRGYYGWLVKLLDVRGPQPLRNEVASIVGQTAMLVGWLLFLTEDRGEARSYWATAHDLSREFANELLYAHVLVARSSLSSSLPHGGRDGDSSVSIPLLDAAEARGRRIPIFRAWALSRRAEEHAAAGDTLASDRDQADAQRNLAVATEAEVILLGPRTEVDLAGYRGNCAVLLGRDDLAAEVLRGAVDAAPRARATLRAVLLNDLGAALARLNELDLACAAFKESLDLAAETGAAVHVQRVAGAVQRFCACQESGTLSELRERLALLV